MQMLAVCLTLNAHQNSVYSSSFRVTVMLKNEVQHLRNQDILLLKTTFKNYQESLAIGSKKKKKWVWFWTFAQNCNTLILANKLL